MQINNFKTICCALAIFISCRGLSQTTTVINYQTWTGASGCNIFSSATNVPVTVGGTSSTSIHQTNIGQPQYDAINDAVALNCNLTLGIPTGTEYRLAYPFQQGSSYSITINAACINFSGSNARLGLELNSGGNGSNTTCSGPAAIDPAVPGEIIFSNVFNNFSYTFNSIPLAQSLLNVSAIPPFGSSLQTILIRKITIVETGSTGSPCQSAASVNICNPQPSGSHAYRVSDPLTLNCNAFANPGSNPDIVVRQVMAPSITLTNGFIASSVGNHRFLQIKASDEPCSTNFITFINDTTQVTLAADQQVFAINNLAASVLSPGKNGQAIDDLYIYPVPSSGIITIQVANAAASKNRVINVYDQMGKVLYESASKPGDVKTRLNLSHLSNGVYFVKVKTADKTLTRKIIISK